METALVVIAKAPSPGRSKTRLCPPLSHHQAAELAAASLRDTLTAVAATPARLRLLALDGDAHGWLPPGFELHRQRGEGLGERLADALLAARGPALVVGMDTPQLTPARLRESVGVLLKPGIDAVLGPALDGGYWTIGLREPDPRVFDGVPMSSPDTCRCQHERLVALGLSVAMLEPLRDVDTIEDARAVAPICRGGEFGPAFRRIASARCSADDEQAVPVPAAEIGL